MTILKLLTANPKHQFTKWHNSNPTVVRAFVSIADELVALGRTEYSAASILHKVRTDLILNTPKGRQPAKINNQIGVFLGRYYNELRNTNFFRTRAAAIDR